MKVKFKLETYDAENPDCKISVCTGTSDNNDIERALEYLLQLKEERYVSGQRHLRSNT